MLLSRCSLILASIGGFVALSLLYAAPEPVAKQIELARHQRLLEIAKHYKSDKYATPVDGHIPHWAPLLCRMPEPGKDYLPARPRVSASKDVDTHGQKIYFLFAQDQDAYLSLGKKTVPVGQFVVKESWHPEEYVAEAGFKHPGVKAPEPFVTKDGKRYKPGKAAGLYIMYKTEPTTTDTDQGWVYGTISAASGRVTASGKIESCIACHEQSKHDRLFGLPKEDVERIKSFITKTKRDR